MRAFVEAIVDAAFAETNPVPVKWVMAELGLLDSQIENPAGQSLCRASDQDGQLNAPLLPGEVDGSRLAVERRNGAG
jgi:hypothetical protein